MERASQLSYGGSSLGDIVRQHRAGGVSQSYLTGDVACMLTVLDCH